MYFFFRDLKPPSGLGSCLVANAEEILRKELKYVQRGLLSDLPGMEMYIEIGVYAKSGRKKMRCIRGTNALEGQHMHTRQARRRRAWSSRTRARACSTSRGTPRRSCARA